MSEAAQSPNRGKRELSHPRAAQGLIVLVALLIVWLAGASPLGHLADNNAADAFFRWFPATQADRATVSTLLAIDEATLSAHGGVRRLRTIVTEAVEALAAHPPKVLAIDLTMADAGDPAEDARLSAALTRLPHVVLGAEIRSDAQQWEQPPPSLLTAHTVLGHVHAAPDPMDSVCREIPLEKAVGARRYWALSLEAMRLWRDEPYLLETPTSLLVGSIEIPARRDTGRLLRIRYLPPSEEGGLSSIRRLSVAELLANPESARSLRDGVAFLGVTAPSAARDRLMTPFSYGRSMQGVEIHANAFETLASGRFLRPVRSGMLLLGALLLAGFVWWGFALFDDWRAYAIAAVALLSALILPPAAFVQSNLASAAVLVGSAWLPFLGLAGHRYWFVDRKLKRATRETENYRNAIHYVTHEMRTPLTAIQGSSELISRYRLGDEKQKQIATMIHSESKRLGRLIQVFLDVERLSAGEMELRMERFPIESLVTICLERARPLADGKDILLKWQSAPEDCLDVVGDRELLEHALYNLVTNAIKYSSAGTTVQVSASNDNGMLRLAVADEGMGLTLEEQKAVFRKFYRTDGAEQSGERGSGIGLSIVEQIVSAHNGRIELASSPGVGSTFTLVLPMAMES
ncbi:MAG: CHASE2 domain-containing protein [Bryobacterales bacterium]|nr:CHASE2 domain-containing protein [Bryobacterales bacterium]